LAGFRSNLDCALEVADVAADDVHPHSAAGNVGDLRGGGQPRQEYQLERSLIGHTSSGLRREQTLGDGLAFKGRSIEATPVVGDLDSDASGFVMGPQRQLSGRIFPLGAPFLRRLNTMVHGITDYVNQRIADLLENRLVQFDALAVQH